MMSLKPCLCYLNNIKEVDECLSNPCRHGKCINLLANYKCACELGFTGYNCQNGTVIL